MALGYSTEWILLKKLQPEDFWGYYSVVDQNLEKKTKDVQVIFAYSIYRFTYWIHTQSKEISVNVE